MEIKLKVNPSINFKAPATYNASPAHKPPQGIIQLKSNAADLRRIIPGFLKHAPNTTLANFGNFSKKFDYQLPVFDVRLRDKEDKKDKS